MRFKNREHAAALLVERLRPQYKSKNPLVLGVPRGAVPMAKIIADALGGELDVVLVHKLTHPESPELAIGAIDESGRAFVSDWAADLDPEYLAAEKQRQLSVLRKRRAAYTPLRAPIDPSGRIVIVVDDGIATGASMIAALHAAREKAPARLVCAAPVAAAETLGKLKRCADEVVCLETPLGFHAVGQFYRDFRQVGDEEVISLLAGNLP